MTTIELEAKLKVESHEPARSALAACGATYLSRALETNYILDRADGSLRKNGAALRVRAIETLAGAQASATLTYKGPRRPSRLKSREEREVALADAEGTVSILEAIGFVTRLTFQKKRETWKIDDCWVMLDVLPELGRFIEIEGPSEASIDRVRQRLDLADQPHIDQGYATMLGRWCADHGVDDRRVIFSGSPS